MTETIAVIGLGAMGSRLAANLLTAGYPVVVFNRSPAPVAPLVAAGASSAASPAEAAAQADAVLVVVADDDASRAVWAGIRDGAKPGTLGIEASTLSPECLRELAATAGDAGVRFLEAPMVGSRPQVESRALVHLVGGPAETLEAAREILAVSSPHIHHVGDYGAAATFKLIINTLLATEVATTAELLGLARRAGIDVAGTSTVLNGLSVMSPTISRAIGVMTTGNYAPNFPVRLAAKDLRYLTRLAAELGGEVPMAQAALAGLERTSAAGHADSDVMSIATIF